MSLCCSFILIRMDSSDWLRHSARKARSACSPIHRCFHPSRRSDGIDSVKIYRPCRVSKLLGRHMYRPYPYRFGAKRGTTNGRDGAWISITEQKRGQAPRTKLRCQTPFMSFSQRVFLDRRAMAPRARRSRVAGSGTMERSTLSRLTVVQSETLNWMTPLAVCAGVVK